MLTSLGAGLVVGAAAPLASAATVTDAAPLIDSQNSTILAPSDQTSAAQNSVSVDSDSSHVIAPASVTTGLADGALTASEVALSGATTADWSRLGRLKLYPLAGTGVDPLSNVVATNLGGIPVSTAPVTQMVEDGLPVNDLPLVGALLSPPNAR